MAKSKAPDADAKPTYAGAVKMLTDRLVSLDGIHSSNWAEGEVHNCEQQLANDLVNCGHAEHCEPLRAPEPAPADPSE